MLSSALFNGSSLEAYEDAVRQATAVVAEAAGARTSPVSAAPVPTLRERVHGVDLDTPLGSLEGALQEAKALYLDHAMWFHHPRYLAHLNCPVAIAAIAADVIASSVNTSVDTWDQSLAATHMEQQVIDWTAERLGLGDLADGVFTSGGTASNTQALLLARGGSREGGRPDSALRVLTSPEAHFSVRKAARTLGLDDDAVVLVETDARGRMRPDALEAALSGLRAQGLHPMAVVATAGTTDRGAVDPLRAIGEVCARIDVWLHVDAAVGGALVTSRTHRELLDGVERADSVTVDYHKTWYQPLAASALLVRDHTRLRHVRTNAEYLNPEQAPYPNLVDKSMQTSRRFDALKLWMTLRTHGADGVGAWLDASLAIAQQAYELARENPFLEVLERPMTHMLLFRYVGDADDLDEVNDAIRERLFERGSCAVARTRHDGSTWLKLTLLNPATEVDDLRAVLDDVVRTGLEISPRDVRSTSEVSA